MLSANHSHSDKSVWNSWKCQRRTTNPFPTPGFGFANMFPKLGAIHAIPDGLTLCTNTQHLHMHMFSQLCDCWFCIKTVKKHKQYVMDSQASSDHGTEGGHTESLSGVIKVFERESVEVRPCRVIA